MSDYFVQDFHPIEVDIRSDPKLTMKDNLETDAVPQTDDALSKSQEMRRQIQPLLGETNQTGHVNDNTLDEHNLCREVNRLKISADDNQKHLEQYKEQNYESAWSGNKTPDLLQHVSKTEHGADNHDFNSGCADKAKLNKRGSLETDAVPLDYGHVKIKSHSASADDPGMPEVQDKPGEAQAEKQNGESRNKTPGQHGSKRDYGAVNNNVNSGRVDEGNAARGAPDGRCNASEKIYQPELTTRPKCLPPTTKPLIAGTARTSQQAQQMEEPRTPNPTQESTSQPLLKPANKEPPVEEPVEEEHYDVLLLYSEHDQNEAAQFMAIADGANWKVATSNDFMPTQPKLTCFEDVFERSSYTVLLLTSNFVADVWCEHRYQTALIQSIENPSKRYCVIPIICQEKNLQLPLALSVYTSVKLTNPKIEKILQKTIKVAKRLKREEAAGLTRKDTGLDHVVAVKSNVNPPNEKTSLSLDDVYHQQRPELQPGVSAAQIMSPTSFSKLCVFLDIIDPLENDWRKLALLLGFSSNMVLNALSHEKSHTAKILECFFKMEIGAGKSKSDILIRLTQVLMEMHRVDAVQLLMEGK